ncbi:MAG: NAD(P)/FAD-dependent oxidoreductase [Flavobacteriales bacterium]|nr:NAD(P)/FAD-dependent oxidoreductase [Flavobacteriales bacterium]
MQTFDTIIVGGGAAGFFAAIRLAELKPKASILILEKTSKLLSKVEISGGGRCNVTNACFDNKLLSENYPRGSKELLGCFYRFNTADTVKWFESRGVALKSEIDGRMFPITDDSQTIMDCLLKETQQLGVEISIRTKVEKIESTDAGFLLLLDESDRVACKTLLIATGGHPKRENFGYLDHFKHKIENPVPSLFTFNLRRHPICQLPGVSVTDAIVTLPEHKEEFRGPLLITHWGLSGPAVLKLSAFAARKLHDCGYRYTVEVNWLPNLSQDNIFDLLKQQKSTKTSLRRKPFDNISQRLWDYFLDSIHLSHETKWADCQNAKLSELAQQLYQSKFESQGKTTFKDEFVTCGGISRKEIDFRTMESKLHPNLFFAGEVIDIDGITGGFNFQAAWTCGYIAGEGIAGKL